MAKALAWTLMVLVAAGLILESSSAFGQASIGVSKVVCPETVKARVKFEPGAPSDWGETQVPSVDEPQTLTMTFSQATFTTMSKDWPAKQWPGSVACSYNLSGAPPVMRRVWSAGDAKVLVNCADEVQRVCSYVNKRARATAAPAAGEASGRGVPGPHIDRIEPTPEGYALIGSGFGADKSKVKLLHSGSPIPATVITSVTPQRIDTTYPIWATLANVRHSVTVSDRSSNEVVWDHERHFFTCPNSASATVTFDPGAFSQVFPTQGAWGPRTTPMPIASRSFSTQKQVVACEYRIEVPDMTADSFPPPGKVILGCTTSGRSMECKVEDKSLATAAAEAAKQGRRQLAPPHLDRVELIRDGYALIGSGFGADKTKVKVLHAGMEVPDTDVRSVTGQRIDVRSPVKSNVLHSVKVSGQESNKIMFDHGAYK